MQVKVCFKCRKEKSLNEFYKNKRCKDNFNNICKNCMRTPENLKSRQASMLKYVHDLIPEQRQDIFDTQKGCCAICGIHETKLNRILEVDHNHKTGVIRGLLCREYNIVVGFYEKRSQECRIYLKETPQRMVKIYKRWLSN